MDLNLYPLNRKSRTPRSRRGAILPIALRLGMVMAIGFSAASAQAPKQPAPTASAPTASAPSTPGAATANLPAVTVSPEQQRKDQIAADTAKLLDLANELKMEMDKSTKDTLSLSVMKKAEEVEKLAHKVRDEMRTSLLN